MIALIGASFSHRETARKNTADEWWDTLKWVYTEAKESTTDKNTFKAVAAARILQSLNQDHKKLTSLQKGAVESISDMFAEAQQPEVQEAISPVYESFGKVSPFDYEQAVALALASARLIVKTGQVEAGQQHIPVEGGGFFADFVWNLPEKQKWIIEAKNNTRPLTLKSIQSFLTAVQSGQGVTAGLLVCQGGVTPGTQRAIETNYPGNVAIVQWKVGDGLHDLIGAIRKLSSVKTH